MRKIIETFSTLVLWAVFIIGSSSVISEFFSNQVISEKITKHLTLVAWSPVLALGLFTLMLIAIRFSKYQPTKKTIPSEHAIQWTAEDLINAKNGKMVDLHFPAAGLACDVVIRHQEATVLHSENQTVYVTLVPQAVDEVAARELAVQRA